MRVGCFHVIGVRADIADVRKRESHDLRRVGRIGHDLLIAGHRGVETHLTHRRALGPESAPINHGAVRKDQYAGRIVGARRSHAAVRCDPTKTLAREMSAMRKGSVGVLNSDVAKP